MRRIPFCFCILALILFLAGCAGKSTIVNNVSERESNEIVVLLNSKGVAATKVPAPVSAVGGAQAEVMWDITVPPHQITESLAILNQAGLPRTRGKNLLDLFGTSGLVPSDLQDRIRYQEGLSEQLANTIRKMDGIIDAAVQITFPSSEEEARNTHLTASVYVKHRGLLDNPNCLLTTKIKRLVACAVPGLDIDNVCVIADRAILSEISLPERARDSGCEMDYVSIWGVIVAKESASLFRFIFYIFLILLFLLICALAWLIWKFYPYIRTAGGYRFLFNSKQAVVEKVPAEETVVVEETEE